MAKVRWVETKGDLDKTTSLRTLGKSDFFTRELDLLLLQRKIDLALHSAKDLPDPLPKGLFLLWLSACLDPRDALVYQKEPICRVATSSERREEAVRSLYPDVEFTDLRGTIGERLERLDRKEVDGVVVAEAALLRLGWTHLKRVYLPGETTPGQGQLALIVREEEREEYADALFRT